MPQIDRVLIPEDSHDPVSWQLALAYAEAICAKNNNKVQDVILYTDAKAQLKDTVLSSHIGESSAKMLLKGDGVQLSFGPLLLHRTLRTSHSCRSNTVVIAFFATDSLMEEIDAMTNIVGIVAVPDLQDSAMRWVKRWNPLIHGQPSVPEAKLIEDQVFENALTSLTRLINLGNGLLNPRDKQYADETLRILKAHGHTEDAENVKSWAIKNGWKPAAANELANLAQKIGGLKTRPRLTKIHNAKGKYDRWLTGGEAEN